MLRNLLSFLFALVGLGLVALALPTYVQDDHPPDLITVVNQASSGGSYYLKSFAEPGLEGDCAIRHNWDSPSYSKEHELLAPNFFIKGGDLFSLTNSTHILQIVALNMTHHPMNDWSPESTGNEGATPGFRYKLQMVEPKKAKKNTGVGVSKYPLGMWSWSGPILLYSFGPQHKELKGSLFYSCPDGVYLDMYSGPPPPGCEPVTLHSRNILRHL